jgi:hypothetical protein
MTEAPETPEMDGTRDVRSIARNGSGRFVRTAEDARKQERAYLLSAQGWSLRQIAEEVGYASRGAASTAIKQHLVQVSRENGTEARREQQLAEMDELRRLLWEDFKNPPPLVSRTGRIVVDDNGDPVPDVAARNGSAREIIHAAERVARLRGLDSPRKSVNATMNWADVEGVIRMAETEVLRLGEQRAEDERRARVIQAQPLPDSD